MPDVEHGPDTTITSTRRLVGRRLAALFAFSQSDHGAALGQAVADALRRCATCFAAITNKYYRRAGESWFDPFHSGQYGIFLYYLSSSLSASGRRNRSLADRVYYLNKTPNSVDMYHEVEQPQVFFCDHPIGSVLDRASCSDYFSFSQSCKVGNNRGIYPTFGRNVHMMSGAKVLGACEIGDHVVLLANCHVRDTSIPSCPVVFGSSPDLVSKSRPRDYLLEKVQTRFLLPESFVDEPCVLKAGRP